MTKKITIILILVFVAIGALLIIPSSRLKILGTQLAYKYQPGKTTEYNMIYKMKVTRDLAVAPDEIKEKFKQSNENYDKTVNVKMTREIKSVKNSEATIEIVRQLKEQKDESKKSKEKKDSETPAEPQKHKMVIIASTKGIVTGLETAGANPITLSQIGQNLILTQIQIPLPTNTIKPGQTWEQKVNAPYQIVKMPVLVDGDLVYKFEKIEKFGNTDCALIIFSGNFKIKPEGFKLNAGQSVTGNSQGKIYFDINEGEVVSVENQMIFNQEANFKAKTKDKGPQDVKLIEKVSYTTNYERATK